MIPSILSHGSFSVERDRQGNLIFMFGDKYSFEFEEFVDFLKLLQLDQRLWKELASLYASQRAVPPVVTPAKGF